MEIVYKPVLFPPVFWDLYTKDPKWVLFDYHGLTSPWRCTMIGAMAENTRVIWDHRIYNAQNEIVSVYAYTLVTPKFNSKWRVSASNNLICMLLRCPKIKMNLIIFLCLCKINPFPVNSMWYSVSSFVIEIIYKLYFNIFLPEITIGFLSDSKKSILWKAYLSLSI